MPQETVNISGVYAVIPLLAKQLKNASRALENVGRVSGLVRPLWGPAVRSERFQIGSGFALTLAGTLVYLRMKRHAASV